jgi:hypothetical protein
MYLVETDRADPVPVEDLRGPNGRKLVVRAGVPVWITWEQKRASTCLRRLEGLGHVRVTPGEQARSERPPQKPKAQAVHLSRPQRRPTRVPPAPETFTKEQLDAAVNQAAAKASKQTAAAIMGQLKDLLPSASPAPEPASVPVAQETSGLEERVEAAVEKALSKATFVAPSAPSGGSSKPKSSGPEEPLFIPTGIVGTDDTELSVKSESSEDDGLADAAAQLKKLRQKKES